MTCIFKYESPLGKITVSGEGEKITGLWFEGQKYFGSTLPEKYEEKPLPVFDEVKHWLDIYFSGKVPDFIPPLKVDGTDFGVAVLNELLNLPFGQTVTYKELAEAVAKKTGRRTSARAVGAAVGRNPVSLIIPCHRVIGSDGSLTGYAGGINRKRFLLDMEGIPFGKN